MHNEQEWKDRGRAWARAERKAGRDPSRDLPHGEQAPDGTDWPPMADDEYRFYHDDEYDQARSAWRSGVYYAVVGRREMARSRGARREAMGQALREVAEIAERFGTDPARAMADTIRMGGGLGLA